MNNYNNFRDEIMKLFKPFVLNSKRNHLQQEDF
jgi:hypothetical protein